MHVCACCLICMEVQHPVESCTNNQGLIPPEAPIHKHLWSFTGLVITAATQCYGICYVYASVLVYVDVCVGADLQQSPMDVVVLDFGSRLWRKLLQQSVDGGRDLGDQHEGDEGPSRHFSGPIHR